MARSAGGWLHSFSPSANPLPFGHPPSMGRGIDGLLIPLLPPSFGRRWRVAPEVGFALFRFQPTPLPWEGGRWVTHPASPSFLWKEVAQSAEGWLRSFSLSANPLPFGHPPSIGRGVDGLLIPLLPPSSGRRRRVAPEVGFALFRFQPTPCPSGIPLPWEGGRWTTRP